MGAIVFRKVRSDEFHLAHGILISAADWLLSKGIRQWTISYPKELYLTCQEKGWNYALEADGELAVVVTLSWELPAEWAETLGTTPVWWLSKLAAAPAYRGLGFGALWSRGRRVRCGPRLGCRLQQDKIVLTTASQMSTGVRVDQVDHVELFVPDRHQAAQWYQQVLGLKVVPEYEHWADDPKGPLMISSDGGSTKLALFQGVPQGSRETAGFHLVAFRVGAVDFANFLDRLPDLDLTNHRGDRVTADLAVDHAAAYSIYFCDPFGHRLELTTYQYEQAKARVGR